ncbi:MAG: hypothetical protein JNN06_14870 [Gemmobacter sp.]|uniref:CAP domain-containing protein n=1 Tax=Gemmobacter sp. TaxID=1898957 RepID=UPI001A4B032A|nr:CAP domain-containing protein [Gemmobacter sp.]MBL8563552.1 hypothetical protein [Gemmobacter sp.]
MAMTAAEQYALELLNRARLDPLGEARRFGIALNDGVDADDIITAAPMQVLAYNAVTERAAELHAAWMIEKDIFGHKQGGALDGVYERLMYVGFDPGRGTWGYGENLVAISSGNMSDTAIMNEFHRQWMLSPGHRSNMLADSFREIGYVHMEGDLLGRDQVGVEVFGWSQSRVYVTGVAYEDRDKNDFYSIGEGTGGAVFRIEGVGSSRTTAAGGYQALATAGEVVVRVTSPGSEASTRVMLDLSDGNVKLDLVNGNLLRVSGDAALVSGPVTALEALGVLGISLKGNDANNQITGNGGANVLVGDAGSDRLTGNGGNDRLQGGEGADRLIGGTGADRLAGGEGGDRLIGGAGADDFLFAARCGRDRVEDFSASQRDTLVLDDALWKSAGALRVGQVLSKFAEVTRDGVLFDFGDGNSLLVEGLTSTRPLAELIEII